jgi:hypothetical protein
MIQTRVRISLLSGTVNKLETGGGVGHGVGGEGEGGYIGGNDSRKHSRYN